MVSIEGKVVVVLSHRHGSFTAALAVLFAVYYVLNLQYQGEASATLEFVQRQDHYCFSALHMSRNVGVQGMYICME